MENPRNHNPNQNENGGIMENSKIRTIQSLLLTLTLMMAALGVSSAAMAAEMVKDPTTGEMVEAPRYGGTLTYATAGANWNFDTYYGWTDSQNTGVVEKLAVGNWGVSRDEWDLKSGHPIPMSALTGRLAESWEISDDKTIVFHIRQGVRWHDNPPMNGRLLTAQDVEFTFHRMLGMGDFSEAGPAIRTIGGHDEKYPQNQLPYIDTLKWLIIPEEATLMSALRSGKLDLRGFSGGAIYSLDSAASLRETHPDIVLHKQ